MDDYEPFSVRQRNMTQSDQPRIYQYDVLPEAFRVQVIYIWRESAGFYKVPGPVYNRPLKNDPVPNNEFWDLVIYTLSREYGVFDLGRGEKDGQKLCENYLQHAETERALDIIELTFMMIDSLLRKLTDMERKRYLIIRTPDTAISELNERFRQHGIGYRFDSGKLIKMASDYIHENVTSPAIRLLHAQEFAGPSKEFLCAHEHFRHRRYDSAILEASNALESTIKTIFDKRSVPYDKTWTASRLIREFFKTDLIPGYLRSSSENLTNALQALPTIRNKESGHGEGAIPSEVPPYLAEYALNAAAAAILLFVGAHLAAK